MEMLVGWGRTQKSLKLQVWALGKLRETGSLPAHSSWQRSLKQQLARHPQSRSREHQVVMVNVFNLSIWESESVDVCEFKASMVYKVSSRTARAVTQRNPVLTHPPPAKTRQDSKECMLCPPFA